MNLCKCDHAKVENDGGCSTTFFFVCGISGEPTDPDKCASCKKQTERSEGSQ